MMRGGKREGAGRKLGGVNKMSKKAREEAAMTGELPHEYLLRISRGEEIDGYKPTFTERMDAAKAAAPYFAPRLSTTDVNARVRGELSVAEMTDEELLAVVQQGG